MFSLGQIVATPSALAAIERGVRDTMHYVCRHQRGDWGDACREDAQANEDAFRLGMRILSVYYLPSESAKIYVITEHDRSLTTILLAEEY